MVKIFSFHSVSQTQAKVVTPVMIVGMKDMYSFLKKVKRKNEGKKESVIEVFCSDRKDFQGGTRTTEHAEE